MAESFWVSWAIGWHVIRSDRKTGCGRVIPGHATTFSGLPAFARNVCSVCRKASNQDSSVHALRDRLYAALRHEKSCTCGECSGGLNAVDDLVEQLEAAQRDNGRLALEAATADQDWKRAEAEANKLRHALTQVRAECNLPDYIAEFVGEALTPSSPNVRKSWGPERMRHDPEAS